MLWEHAAHGEARGEGSEPVELASSEHPSAFLPGGSPGLHLGNSWCTGASGLTGCAQLDPLWAAEPQPSMTIGQGIRAAASSAVCLQHLLGAPFQAVWTDWGQGDGHKAEKPMVCGCH